MYGETGNDVLHGGNGDDVLYGDDGADKLYGEAGNDVMSDTKADTFFDGGAGVNWYIDTTPPVHPYSI